MKKKEPRPPHYAPNWVRDWAWLFVAGALVLAMWLGK